MPHWTDRPTAGPQLTRGITDAFTMCYAVYRLHAGAVVQDPRVGGPMPYGPTALRLILLQGVPNLADERLKQQAWQFFSQNWARLDEGSRRWIADMPHLWEWFQSKDRQGKNLHPFEQKVLLERYGPFFQWFEGAMRWYQGPRAEPSGASA